MTLSLIVLSAVMFAVAAVFSMLGQGGGVLYTPVQVIAGIDFHSAAATSLLLIMVVSLSATIVFRKAKRVDWPLAIVLESVTVPGGFAGGLASSRFSGTSLTILFAGVIALAAVFMIRNGQVDRDRPARKSIFAWRRVQGSQVYCVNLLVALPVSCLAGVVCGLVGVGGGVLKVPMMVLLFGVPMEIAVGSSAFMIGLTAAGGFAGHAVSGHWDWYTSSVLAVVVFVGAQVGARKSVGIDKNRMRHMFGWFLLLTSAIMVGKALA